MTSIFLRRLCALFGGCPIPENEEDEDQTAETAERRAQRDAVLRDADRAQKRAWETRARASRVVANLQNKKD